MYFPASREGAVSPLPLSTRRTSTPIVRRSLDIKPGPPPPPERERRALASCRASSGDRDDRFLLNSKRDRISSCGSVGVELSSIEGFVAGPLTVTVTVRSLVVTVALIFRRASTPPSALAARSMVLDCSLKTFSRKSNWPRREVSRPVTRGLSALPATAIVPCH